MLRLILVVVLALVLWVLYHKLFHVVYFNALHGLFREIVICLVISIFIVFGIYDKLNSIVHPKEPAPDYLGSFFNMQFIEGSGFETSLMIQKSEEQEGELTISGYSVPVGINYVQSFDISIPYPEENVFSVYDEWHSSTITITFNPDEHTLDVIQETTDPAVPTPFTGHYVDNDVWQGLLEERQAANEAALEAQEPNRWIESYFTYPFGKYVPIKDDGIEDSLITFHTGFSIYESSSRYFHFIAFKDEEILFEENILYPLGDAEAKTFRRTLPEGDVTITACGFSDDGKPMLEISEFPDSDFIGTYIVYTDPPLPEEDAVQEEPADLQQLQEVQDQPEVKWLRQKQPTAKITQIRKAPNRPVGPGPIPATTEAQMESRQSRLPKAGTHRCKSNWTILTEMEERNLSAAQPRSEPTQTALFLRHMREKKCFILH